MNSEQKQALEDRLAGFTFREIADSGDTTIKAVKGTWKRGMRRLAADQRERYMRLLPQPGKLRKVKAAQFKGFGDV